MNTIWWYRSFCYLMQSEFAKDDQAKVKKKTEKKEIKRKTARKREREKKMRRQNRFLQWIEFHHIFRFTFFFAFVSSSMPQTVARIVSYNLFLFNPFGKNV